MEWPASDGTVGGCRGARALEDIASGENMLEIPIKLMMGPPHAFTDPVLGPIIKANEDLLRGDMLLSLFIMFELAKGEDSFYFPYLEMLPEPGSVSQWTEEQLAELENQDLVLKSKNRLTSLRNNYSRVIVKLCTAHPEALPLESFSYEKFLFAWYSVQARAFGKRLQWTAMVPFADCLNHSNLQTKYDYDVGGNGLFRLFPSGANCYPAGSEVFNSYGRRHNENLLMDYGFAMLDNQWDEVDVQFSLARGEENYAAKRTLLFTLLSFHAFSSFSLRQQAFPFDALAFCRVASLTDEELVVAQQLPVVRLRQQQERQERDPSMPPPPGSSSLDDDDDGATPFSSTSVISLPNELQAVRLLILRVRGLVLERVTSVEEDVARLADLQSSEAEATAGEGNTGNEHWRQVCAVTYRLTRKRIVDTTMRQLVAVEQHLEASLQGGAAVSAEELISAIEAAGSPAALDGTGRREVLEYAKNVAAASE